MKTYKNKLPKYIKTPIEFIESIKCKKCGNKFITTRCTNSIREDARIFDSVVVKKFLFFFNSNYTRKKYLRIFIFKTICPTCNKEEILFYSKYPKKQYIYGKWKKINK